MVYGDIKCLERKKRKKKQRQKHLKCVKKVKTWSQRLFE